MNKGANQEPQKFDNASQWEDLMKVATIGNETRQLLIAQGRIIDICECVEKIVTDHWGSDGNYQKVRPLYEKANELRGVINEFMGEIIFDSVIDENVTSTGVKEI